jgi:ABC-2 type transport system ATP-binding protein
MKTVLTCTGLTAQCDGFPALSGVSLNLWRGRIVGLLGAVGGGKTAFMKTAAGLLAPTSGKLNICGFPVGKQTKKIVSYLPDRDCMPDFYVSDLVELYADFYPEFNPDYAFDMLDRLNVDITKKFSALSRGMRRKTRLSLALNRSASLYLLDEPFADIDPASRDFIFEELLSSRDRGATVLISTQLISETEPILDDVLILQNGTVRLYDSAENVRAKTGKSVDEYFREVYRC